MKKSLRLFTIAFALLFVVVIKVNAAETLVATETDLKSCIAAAGTTESTKAICKLTTDIELTDRITVEGGNKNSLKILQSHQALPSQENCR